MISSTVASRIEFYFIDLEIKSKYRERASGSHESISHFLSERKWWYSCFYIGLKSKGSRARYAGKNNT